MWGMHETSAFNEVLQAIDALPLEQQREVVDIVKKRIVDRSRAQLLKDVEEAREDMKTGRYRVASPEKIMREAQR